MTTQKQEERINEVKQAERSKSPEAQERAAKHAAVTGSAPQQGEEGKALDDVSQSAAQGEGQEDEAADPRDGSPSRSAASIDSSVSARPALDEGQDEEPTVREAAAGTLDEGQSDESLRRQAAARGGADRATDSEGKKLVNPLYEGEDRKARPASATQGHRDTKRSDQRARKQGRPVAQDSSQAGKKTSRH